jgi:hypothetical protein
MSAVDFIDIITKLLSMDNLDPQYAAIKQTLGPPSEDDRVNIADLHAVIQTTVERYNIIQTQDVSSVSASGFRAAAAGGDNKKFCMHCKMTNHNTNACFKLHPELDKKKMIHWQEQVRQREEWR